LLLHVSAAVSRVFGINKKILFLDPSFLGVDNSFKIKAVSMVTNVERETKLLQGHAVG